MDHPRALFKQAVLNHLQTFAAARENEKILCL
jgi:hypothetical protein